MRSLVVAAAAEAHQHRQHHSVDHHYLAEVAEAQAGVTRQRLPSWLDKQVDNLEQWSLEVAEQ